MYKVVVCLMGNNVCATKEDAIFCISSKYMQINKRPVVYHGPTKKITSFGSAPIAQLTSINSVYNYEIVLRWISAVTTIIAHAITVGMQNEVKNLSTDCTIFVPNENFKKEVEVYARAYARYFNIPYMEI
jgi:hypothetical protein